jgi:hypothetical protein
VLSTITWVGPDGGDWDTPANWSPAQVPTSSDNAVITPSSAETILHGSNSSDAVLSLTTNSNATLTLTGGSINIGILGATLGGPVTVEPGTSFNVGTGASVTIQAGQTLTDNGTVSFASGDAVALDGTSGGFGGGPGPAQIVVATNGSGTLGATATNFTTNGVGKILVGAGAKLTASSSKFALSELSFDNASVMKAGDLSNDIFNQAIAVPYNDVQYLAGNVSFQDIDINPNGTVSSGTLALDAIGTNPTNLRYVFPGNFAVGPGATLSVGANVSVLIEAGVTLTDNGTLSFASGDAVALDGTTGGFGGGPGPAQIVVATNDTGTFSAATTNFTTNGVGNILVGAGGELMASSSKFALSELSFDDASVMKAGDLVGDTFNQTISLPYNEVQYLAGNVSFQDIDINPNDTISSGTLALDAIGTNPTNLRYVFPGNFAVGPGATLSVGANVAVLVEAGVTLTDNGTLSFANGDGVALNGTTGGFGGGPGPAQIVVATNQTGAINAAGTDFTTNGVGKIAVGSGGNFDVAGSKLALSSVTLSSGSTDAMTFVIFSGQLNIDSGDHVGTPANPTITGNDFSAVGANGIVATGDPNASIPFAGNYWGTTVTSQI